jgi:hypothetical protein
VDSKEERKNGQIGLFGRPELCRTLESPAERDSRRPVVRRVTLSASTGVVLH